MNENHTSDKSTATEILASKFLAVIRLAHCKSHEMVITSVVCLSVYPESDLKNSPR